MSGIDAAAFAREWLAAWNSHDLERILSHYATGIVFLSPFAHTAFQVIGRSVPCSSLSS